MTLLVLRKNNLKSKHGITRSKSALNKEKRNETMTQTNDAQLFNVFRKEVVQKCFIDQDVLQENNTFAIKVSLYGPTKEGTIMCLSKSMHALQRQRECMQVFSLIGLDQLF